jgi:hypothetical protein
VTFSDHDRLGVFLTVALGFESLNRRQQFKGVSSVSFIELGRAMLRGYRRGNGVLAESVAIIWDGQELLEQVEQVNTSVAPAP